MTENINSENVKEHVAAPAAQVAGAVRPPRTPAWWDFAVMFLLFVLSQGAAGAICYLLGIGGGTPAPAGDADAAEAAAYLQGRYVAVSYFISMAICLPLLWYYRGLRGWPVRVSFAAPGWASPFRLLCGYALLWCVTVTVEPLASLLPSADSSMLGGGGWLLVSAVVLAPLFEETVFRGYMAGAMRSAYGGVAAWIGSSVVFGIVHVIPASVVNAVFCGLVLGFYYLRYRSLVLVILLHAMNNITACFLRTVGLGDASVRDVAGDAYWAVYASCALITLLASVRMFQLVRRIKSDNYRASE